MKTLKQLIYISFVILLSLVSRYLVAESSVSEKVLSEDDLIYTVQENDTVWGVCKIYVTDPLCWLKLVEYNQLKNPKYLPPKSIIKIPKSWLIDHSTTALVIAVEGDVLLVRKNSQQERRLNTGDLLSQEDIVKSMDGTAMIKFADNSRLLLKANSIIRMDSLQFNDLTRLIDTRVELLKGRVKSQVERLSNKNSHYYIFTPAAVAAVRGTEFRVSRSKNSVTNAVEMRTELLTGALLVSSDINQKKVKSGQGVLAIEGVGVSEPIKLLPRPLMALNESQSIALPLLLKWQAIEQAQSYKVTLISKDSQIWERTTENSELLIEDINSGQYQLLIRGVDSKGFEGRNRRLNIEFSEPTPAPTP
ncbi:MAG: FecR domain-containing protein [Oleispira sp.]|nr:FecR domain-containing protein [Oleispira sp.]MBL4882417.1 FecR domain-containing protein [Oleispira sp.]